MVDNKVKRSTSGIVDPEGEPSLKQESLVRSHTWQWRGHQIAYKSAMSARSAIAQDINLDSQNDQNNKPALVLIHGFGASSGHWRKNMPALADVARVFAIDLLGFGASDKPVPSSEIAYTFETWAAQVIDFCREIVGTEAILVGNSIGAMVAMQAAIFAPDLVVKTVLINCSLRLLHETKQLSLPWYRRVGARFLQRLLTNRAIAKLFFDQMRRPQTVRKILLQAYINPAAVDQELLDILLAPAADPHAVDVFMAFVHYSQGPLPEELLAELPCEAIVLWGEDDPWEPIALGREFTKFDCVKEFITLPGVGHCPQDEAPELVNPILRKIAIEST
jgi:pimeloyl-ACP methyl ester carboxylesterase